MKLDVGHQAKFPLNCKFFFMSRIYYEIYKKNWNFDGQPNGSEIARDLTLCQGRI